MELLPKGGAGKPPAELHSTTPNGWLKSWKLQKTSVAKNYLNMHVRSAVDLSPATGN
jgi:hypothetical protein